jgi:hypothetical protein
MADHDGCSATVPDLLLHLPDNLYGLWLDFYQLHNILKHKGFSLLPNSVNCLKGNREDSPQPNKQGNKTYWQHGDTTNKAKCYKKQRGAVIPIPEFVDRFYMQEGSNFFFPNNQAQLLKGKGYCEPSIIDTTPTVQEMTPVYHPPEPAGEF